MQTILHFGCDFDGPTHAPVATGRAGEQYVGPRRLLLWLEAQLGLSGHPENTDYLRIELYRQAMATIEAPFFAASFAADRFATAQTLLAWRDELLLAGWNFEIPSQSVPAERIPRLHSFASIEKIFQEKINALEIYPQATGHADRWVAVLNSLQRRSLSLSKLVLHEPFDLQTPVIQRLVNILSENNIAVEAAATVCAAAADTALGRLQRRLFPSGSSSHSPQKDVVGEAHPTLLILHARRDSDAATYLAQLLRENRTIRPFFLVPEMSLLLEQALVQEGMPALGILSASLARPSLQVLKLAPAFLWEPVDVFKLMEFVTLPVKPLDTGLALEIARVLAQKPGLNSDSWFAAVFGYLEQAEAPEEAREQYEFWFNRRRYKADSTAPKRDAMALYGYLHQWAREKFEAENGANSSLLVLAEQARRIRELLDTLPEQRISFLELERIVRTIYEPSPVQFSPAEAGSFGFVHQPGAVAAPVETLIWWNCLYQNAAPPPDKWTVEERLFLKNQGITLYAPRQESQLQLLRQQRPVLQTAQQLILVVPEQADGAEAVPNLLLGDIEAAFPEDKQRLHFRLDDEHDRARLKAIFALSARAALPVRMPARPRPHLLLPHSAALAEGEYETPTNLESLFYYPHRWFFKQKLRLFPSSLLSVTGDNTLLGSLAHRFFEILLRREDLATLDRRAIQDWVDAEAATLLEREGATLLLYGREPDRNAFLNKVKNAAWSLVSLLRNNGWSVAHTELALEGHFGAVPVRGKADLVLRRADEMAIVDLKWSGAKRRKEMMINGEDLQLVLYAKLLPPPEQWPHTAYFILDDGKIIARNGSAFKEAVVAGNHSDHAVACEQVYARMERTYAWRLEQLRKGMIELRTKRTAPELEALYEGQLFDLLEMKDEDARWDDYRTLLGQLL